MNRSTYRISDHAREEAERRGIPLRILDAIMESPGQIVDSYNNRKIYQSKVEIGGKLFIIRAVVALTNPRTVVTVYRTSQIDKYWENT